MHGALDIQTASQDLIAEGYRRDGVELRLRVGLNSGQVIAGEIGSASGGYTAIGAHVGMAQRMESVAPPGGVMLSDSTARLVGQACAARRTANGADQGRRFARSRVSPARRG